MTGRHSSHLCERGCYVRCHCVFPQLMHLAECPGVVRGNDTVPGLVGQEVMQ